MADTAERVILQAEDEVSPAVNSANAGLDSFEKKAVSAHTNVVRITDQSRSAVQRLITSLEKQADTYGKSGVDKLIVQRDQLLQRYAKEPTAIDAVTKSYERMIAVEEKAARENSAAKHAKETEEALKKHTEAIKGFGEKVTEFIENPLQGAKGAISSVLTTMGPFGVGILAGAAALTGLAAAGYEATKSLAEYGLRAKDAELRTGFTLKEFGEFSFAAKAVGQDISIVERMMRGLSQAESDNSKEGEKAKSTLKNMGVELRDLRTGEMKPTSEALRDIAEGLAKLPAGVERDAAAIAIFKKAGIEAIPMMVELVENIKKFDELGGGGNQADIDRWTKYNAKIAEADTLWDRVFRKLKDGIAGTIWIDVKTTGAKWILDYLNKNTRQDGPEPTAAEKANGPDIPGAYALRGWVSGMFGGNSIDVLGARKPLGAVGAGDFIPTGVTADGLRAQDAYSASQGPAGRLKLLERELGKMTKPEDLTPNAETGEKIASYAAKEKEIEGLKSQIEAGKHSTAQAKEELKAFQHAAAEFEKKGDEAELDAIDKIYYARDVLLKQAAHVKASESDIALVRKAADEQALKASDKIIEKNRAERASFEAHDAENSATRLGRISGDLFKTPLKDWKEQFAADEQIENIQMQSQRGELQRRAGQSFRSAQLSADALPKDATIGERAASEERVAKQAFDTRVNLAMQLTAIEVDRISKEDDANKKRVMAAQAQKDLYTQLAEAQDQFAEKELEIQHKRNEEIEKQIDGLQSKSEKLFETLFTKPKDFGKELGSTLHAAVLKPVIETVSKGAANLLHPLIYGKDGDGGINGMFHPGKDPVRVSTDQNTSATLQNSAVMAALTAVLAAGMGIAAPQVAGTAGAPSISIQQVTKNMSGGNGVRTILDLATGRASASGGGFVSSGGSFSPSYSGTSSDGLPMSSVRSFMPDLSFGSAQGGGASSWTDGSSATPTFMGNGGTSRSGGGGLNIGGLLGGLTGGGTANAGGGGLGGILGNLKGLKSSFWNNDIYTSAGNATTAAGIGGIKGDAAAILSSKGAASLMIAGGTPLAMAGITGSRRGTWGGIAEATGGGALVGAGIGTMIMPGIGTAIGAGVGAAAGFGIGVGEKIFGVVSLEQTAHDDIKSMYGVDIPVKSGIISQIVAMAKQQFGGSVSIAVRSPSARQLIMLYSEASGQKTPLSSTTPYAGSLVESRGSLYQQASYLDGQAHTYASNIPTLGGLSSSNYPTPGGPNTAGGAGPTYLSLNIGADSTAGFMTGQYVTPQFVSQQVSAGQNASIDRTQQAANMQLPGLSVG